MRIIVPKARTGKLVVEELPGEVLVYDLERHQAHCLNATAAAIWRACDGSRDVEALARHATAELGVAVDEETVRAALVRLRRARLLEAESAPLAALTRREAIRRLVRSGAVVLPLVLSIAAPAAAEAGSCIPSGQPCQPGGTPCCSGLCVGNVCWP